jgi:SAM-dependent methyltransferase
MAETRMEKFQITLVRPQGFLHTEAFREVAETLQFGLRSLGHAANIQENHGADDATNIYLGAHLLAPEDAERVPAGSIIYNLEQLGGASLPPAYYQLAAQREVWDYSLQNIDRWKAMKCKHSPLHVPVGYVPDLTRIDVAQVQDIDILFYGSLNERRRRVLLALKNAGVKIRSLLGVYGEERDRLSARSKVILNINFYEAKIFEIVRVSYLLANSKAVVTECSIDPGMETGLSGAVKNASYDFLVEACVELLSDDEKRRQLEIRGFQWFSRQKEPDILSRALTQRSMSMTATAATVAQAVPRKLNMGSGKDWRQDYFNVDVDSYWRPDAVLDFNRPLPIGQPFETERFGVVALENNFFDEIIANDCLEHIPNLTTAMSGCLSLLRAGGEFRISVPYELSWGAWQDPTHVRAFNERSWLYYTDWFWYMGWTEARFDLVKFDLELSPLGRQLAQQVKGEDLVRVPRAVDQMKVVLKKRALTESEKKHVQTYLQRPFRSEPTGNSRLVTG